MLCERAPESPVSELSLLFYENLAPCQKKTEMVPLGCWTGDADGDFAVAYSSTRDALIHFVPQSAQERDARIGSLEALSDGAGSPC